MNAFQICSEVYGLSGFDIPSAFFNGSDADDRLITFLLRSVGRDIAKYRWQQLVVTGRISVQSDKTEYNMPSDFRELIPGTMRTDGDLRPLDFPANFETWAQIDSNVGPTGIQHRLRFQGDKLVTMVQDNDSYTIRFEYISDFPVLDIASVRKDNFTEDNDTWILDDDIIIKGLKARWSLEKGLETYQLDKADFEAELLEHKGTQATSQRIMLGGKSPYWPQAPYTNLWK